MQFHAAEAIEVCSRHIHGLSPLYSLFRLVPFDTYLCTEFS